MNKEAVKTAKEKTYPVDLTEKEIVSLGGKRWVRSKSSLFLYLYVGFVVLSLIFLIVASYANPYWLRGVAAVIYIVPALVGFTLFFRRFSKAGKTFLKEVKANSVGE